MATQQDTIIFSYIGLIILTLGLLLHFLGLYLLSHFRQTRTHQNVILMNLGFAEIIMSATGIAEFSYEISEKIISRPALLLSQGSVITFYLVMITLTLDRLFMILLSIRYNIVVTRKKMRVVLMFCWLIGFIGGAMLSISNSYQDVLNGSLNGIFLVLAVTTYAIIFGKAISGEKQLSESISVNSTSYKRQDNHLSKFYCMAGLIIATFIIFVTIPIGFKVFYPYPEHLVSRIISNLWYVDVLLDPCIYIFLQRPVRTLLKKKLIGERQIMASKERSRRVQRTTTV